MKKKRQILADEFNHDIDLKSLIHENSLFFDKLTERIPVKFYLPVDDKEKKWFQGLSKDEQALAKESRENIKKVRRDRLDPDKSSATTVDLLMKNLEKEKSNDENDEEEVEINPMISGIGGVGRSATYDELRQRLQRKIIELKGNRNNKVKKDERKGIQQKIRKRESGSEENKPKMSVSAEKVEKDATEAAQELKFSHVKLGKEEELGKKAKKRKLSKLKEFEKAKELVEPKNDPEKGDIISKNHSWKTATSRAVGIKVHDDPKLLKESIKKGKKRHQKNVEKWKERVENQQKMKSEKQQTRSQNIADRIQQKKMRKIAKREKKLMRPGFEGLKEGYVNGGSTEGGSAPA